MPVISVEKATPIMGKSIAKNSEYKNNRVENRKRKTPVYRQILNFSITLIFLVFILSPHLYNSYYVIQCMNIMKNVYKLFAWDKNQFIDVVNLFFWFKLIYCIH